MRLSPALASCSLLLLGACASTVSVTPSTVPSPASQNFRIDATMLPKPTLPPSVMREPTMPPPSSAQPSETLKSVEPKNLPAGITESALVATLSAELSAVDDSIPSELKGVWLWQSPDIYLWAVCRNANTDTGSCILGAGLLRDGKAEMLAKQNVGWDVPTVALGATGSHSVVVSGGSGRGGLTVPLVLKDLAKPSIEFGAEQWDGD